MNVILRRLGWNHNIHGVPIPFSIFGASYLSAVCACFSLFDVFVLDETGTVYCKSPRMWDVFVAIKIIVFPHWLRSCFIIDIWFALVNTTIAIFRCLILCKSHLFRLHWFIAHFADRECLKCKDVKWSWVTILGRFDNPKRYDISHWQYDRLLQCLQSKNVMLWQNRPNSVATKWIYRVG